MLLPNEWIENSIETYIYQHTTKSQVIYWVVLLAVTVTLVALPFIYVDISVQGSGVVRPVAEKAEITSSITEIVDSVFVKEGEQVNKGDVILRFRTNNSDYKINYQTSRLNDCSAQLADLAFLAKGERPERFNSPVRQQEYAYFIRKKQELETALAQAEKEYTRNRERTGIAGTEPDQHLAGGPEHLSEHIQRDEFQSESGNKGQGHVHRAQPGGRDGRPVLRRVPRKQHSGRSVAGGHQPRLHALPGGLCHAEEHWVYERGYAGERAGGIVQLQRMGNDTGKSKGYIIGLPDGQPRQFLLQGEMRDGA